MKTPSDNKHSSKKTLAALFRFGTVFSAAMVVMSLFSGLGTQLINKLGIAQKQAPAAQADSEKGLLPYEQPAFRLFGNVMVNDVKALIIGAPIT